MKNKTNTDPKNSSEWKSLGNQYFCAFKKLKAGETEDISARIQAAGMDALECYLKGILFDLEKDREKNIQKYIRNFSHNIAGGADSLFSRISERDERFREYKQQIEEVTIVTYDVTYEEDCECSNCETGYNTGAYCTSEKLEQIERLLEEIKEYSQDPENR